MPPPRSKSLLRTAAFAAAAMDAVRPGSSITAIRACGVGGSRVQIHIDSVSIGEIPTTVASDLRLAVGAPWTYDLADSLAGAAWDAVTFATLLRLISVRARSRLAYRSRLLQRGYPEAAVTDAMARAIDLALINEAVVLELAISAELRRGYARRVIEQRLVAQGFARDAIHAALSERIDDPREIDTACALAVTWAKRRSGSLDHDVATRRLLGFLARRGFSGESCRNAVAQALPKDTALGHSGYPDS